MARELELIEVANTIRKIVAEIGNTRREIESKGEIKAKTISNYDKQIQISIMKLRDDGKYPATLIEKISKGDCHKERLDMELAEIGYKATISNLNALMAQLNAMQSLFRHLESV